MLKETVLSLCNYLEQFVLQAKACLLLVCFVLLMCAWLNANYFQLVVGLRQSCENVSVLMEQVFIWLPFFFSLLFSIEMGSWSLWMLDASTMATPATSPGHGQSAVNSVTHRGNSMNWC